MGTVSAKPPVERMIKIPDVESAVVLWHVGELSTISH